jgi:GT2 family glycosyltransferase
MDLSIVILSYNGKELMRQTLDSVWAALPPSLQVEVIVSDNGSTDGVVEMIKSEYGWVKLVENGENLGFSAGNNKGVRVTSGQYVLFLNSDTKVMGNAIAGVYSKLIENPEVGVATCRVELSDGSVDPASHRGFPTPWRAFCYYCGLEKFAAGFGNLGFGHTVRQWFGGYHLLDRDLAFEHEIDSCTGAFFMISRELGEQVGWWSEEYFMYGEDLDFCFKVNEVGKKVMYYPQEKILHLKHQSGLKKNSSDQTQEQMEKARTIRRKTTAAFYDAMIIFYQKHYARTYPFFITWLVLLGVRFKKQIALSKI